MSAPDPVGRSGNDSPGDEGTLRRLVERAVSDTDGWNTVAEMRNDPSAVRRVLPRLVELLKDPDEEVRHRALAATCFLGPATREASSEVAKLLMDGDRLVQRWAEFVLFVIDGDALTRIVDSQLELLRDDDPKVRQEAARLLSRLDRDFRASFPQLKRLINDPDPQVVLRAVTALRLGRPQVHHWAVRSDSIGKRGHWDFPRSVTRWLRLRSLLSRWWVPRLSKLLK
jgi:HEAT repeat protein